MASNNFDLLDDPKQSKLNRQNIKSLSYKHSGILFLFTNKTDWKTKLNTFKGIFKFKY